MQFNILDVSLTLALVLHAHQPVDNFDHVIEEAYRTSYEPFLAAAERHPGLRLTLHFSGWLLAWLRARHPEYIARLNLGLQAGRLEILGGGYYEPVLAAIPERDRRLQLERMSELVTATFGRPPRGAWLAERVWEPDLPATLAAAGFEYTIVDDTHLLMTGLEPEQTYGYFIAESGGAAIKLVPSNRFLRFAIPFQAENESLEFLAAAARDQPGALLVMADDLEKFGTWPHTYEHVIAGGWLERFFERLDASGGWLSTATLGAALAASPALGLASPPTASYEEMMQWALPAAAGARLAAARADPATAPYRRFLAGAPWRNFFSKYPESNAIHQYALELSERAAAAQDGAAQEEILAAECNDAYWHGLFGGLYAPHLRNAAYTHLLRAEARLPARETRQGDLDRNGGEVAVLRHRQTRLVIEASDGGVVRELDWLPAAANVVNSLARRPEAYHGQIRAQIAANPAQLPGGAAAPGAELSALLQYDHYRRACHRLYLFPADKTFGDFLRLALAEDPVLAGGRFTLESPAAESAVVAAPRNAARKRFALSADGKLDCTFECSGAKPGLAAGVEMVFNLLAPQAADRAIVAGSERLPLETETEVTGETLAFEDGWRRLRIALRAPGAWGWWLRPIHTVSQSESGYEKVYQGSVAMAVWRTAPALFQLSVEFLPLATP